MEVKFQPSREQELVSVAKLSDDANSSNNNNGLHHNSSSAPENHQQQHNTLLLDFSNSERHQLEGIDIESSYPASSDDFESHSISFDSGRPDLLAILEDAARRGR